MALIGDGLRFSESLEWVLGVVKRAGLSVKGLYKVEGRPSATILAPREELGEVLNTLHSTALPKVDGA